MTRSRNGTRLRADQRRPFPAAGPGIAGSGPGGAGAGVNGAQMNAAAYRWRAADGLVPCEPLDGPLLVADSWLVDNGAVRGLERHYQRFAAACAARRPATAGPAGVDGFLAAVRRVLPSTGRWFPRAELADAAGSDAAGSDAAGAGDPRDPGIPVRLSLLVRPAPAPAPTGKLWIYHGPDPRRLPWWKGPDLPALAGLHGRASQAGADDALLTAADGVLLEAAYSSVLWWEAGTLCVPADGLPVLPGVTVSLIRDRAAALGVPVKGVRRHPEDLDGCEVWMVNALHGIRAVTELAGCTAQPGPATRAPVWRRWLESIAVPVTVPAIP